MNAKRILTSTIVLMLLVSVTGAAWAFPRFARLTKKNCATCHSNVAGGAALTDAGKAFKADTTKAPAADVEVL